jgi:hypothetical protein
MIHQTLKDHAEIAQHNTIAGIREINNDNYILIACIVPFNHISIRD